MNVVLDTNVLVSALWRPRGNPFEILALVLSGELVLCYSQPIWTEYCAVLARPKLNFSRAKIENLLARINDLGLPVTVSPSVMKLPDESDRKFYDAAKACRAVLLTGNQKHFPKENFIVSPAEFLRGEFERQA